jgi:hypothetical protein
MFQTPNQIVICSFPLNYICPQTYTVSAAFLLINSGTTVYFHQLTTVPHFHDLGFGQAQLQECDPWHKHRLAPL